MLVNICIGKDGDADFPEIAQIEMGSVEELLKNKEYIEVVNNHINTLNEKHKIQQPKIHGFYVDKTIFVPKDNNFFVYLNRRFYRF